MLQVEQHNLGLVAVDEGGGDAGLACAEAHNAGWSTWTPLTREGALGGLDLGVDDPAHSSRPRLSSDGSSRGSCA